MPDFDLVIRGGTLAHLADVRGDIAVADGKIVALADNISGTAREEIDASQLHIFPGLIDSHVHFNEPGRAHWEGFETGSRALAAGGGTMFFDMPLNAHPPTIDGPAFDQKLAAAEKSSLTDFAFWGGIVPGNLDKMEELADRGVIGFKAFMADSGIDDFSCVDDNTLREGMKRAAKLKLPVAVHAESDAITKRLAAELTGAGCVTVEDYLQSRPVEAEVDAIRRAVDLAGETGCKLHIVHISSGQGLWAALRERFRLGRDISFETCPHYLTLTNDDAIRMGAVAKCAPPLRDVQEQAELWRELAGAMISDDPVTIGSDHSPSPPDMKTNANFFKVWGGISGVQHTLPLLISCSRRDFRVEGEWNSPPDNEPLSRSPLAKFCDLTFPQIAKLTSFNVAKRFCLPRGKGRIEIGSEANMALIDASRRFTVERDGLFYRHKQSPYIGWELRGKVVRTILHGQTIFQDGKIIAKPGGRLVKPLR